MLMSYLTNSVIYTSIDNSILRRCSFDDLGIDLDIFDRIEILETYLKHSERTAIMGSSSGFHHADHTNYASILSKEETLEQLLLSYEALSEDQTNWVCNLSNASSLLWHAYKSLGVNVNWAGFYVTFDSEKDTLLLGPFQGKVACQKIQFGKGVCGTAASTKETQVVRDVNEYPGHIACDGETKSEIEMCIRDRIIYHDLTPFSQW